MGNKSHIFGYLLGLLIFVIGIPALMWYLMTSGPYRLCRNPMLVGIYIYDAGVLVWLWSVMPLLIVLAEVILLTLQVRSEEKRLEKDFGQEYLDYKKRVGRYGMITI